MTLRRLLPTTLFLLLAAQSLTFAEARIFDLKHRSAVDLAEAVQAVLGEDATVTAVERSLVIDAEPRQLSIVADLLQRLDHPPKMLRVFVAQQSDESVKSSELAVSGRASSDSAAVVVGRPDAPSGGGAIIVGDDGDRLRLDAESSGHRETRNIEQFITTIEGNPARISIGKRIPVTERWLMLTRRHAYLAESVHYESVASGFEVLPELLGEMVQLVIRPYLAFQSAHHAQEVRFEELTTSITVPLGQWLDLGGIMFGQDEVSREILGVVRSGAVGSGVVRVRVELHPE